MRKYITLATCVLLMALLLPTTCFAHPQPEFLGEWRLLTLTESDGKTVLFAETPEESEVKFVLAANGYAIFRLLDMDRDGLCAWELDGENVRILTPAPQEGVIVPFTGRCEDGFLKLTAGNTSFVFGRMERADFGSDALAPENLQPKLSLCDAQGEPLGTTIRCGVGEKNALDLFFQTENADGMRIGWDDQSLDESVVCSIEMEGGFHLRMHSEKSAECEMRFFLSATDDWSDTENPPAEIYVTLVFKQ